TKTALNGRRNWQRPIIRKQVTGYTTTQSILPGRFAKVRICLLFRVATIEAEDINDCYDHWMLWAQIAHADITNIRIEELKEHQAA
ncbi:hypothetical protein GNV84_24030, partial [Escherichia coli]|nr:hypothetical protein [Escherichia coli]